MCHQFSFKEEGVAGTSWDTLVCFKAAGSAAIWHSSYAAANLGQPHIELAQLAYQPLLVDFTEASAYR